MREYLTELQLIFDSSAGCGHPIEEMQWISIILNEVKEQYDNVVSIINASMNHYDLASISSTLLDAEARQKDLVFDNTISISVAKVAMKHILQDKSVWIQA